MLSVVPLQKMTSFQHFNLLQKKHTNKGQNLQRRKKESIYVKGIGWFVLHWIKFQKIWC